jgi:ubiquinone/menaquinone biosynthesis C-methylase UbiE
MDATLRNQIIDIYRRRADNYDFTANLYYLLGYPEWAFRRQAVTALNLKRGATVVEIGCGTGLNFALYQKAIGPEGRIIGVDLTDAMLGQARKRVGDKGWKNVDLVHSDALLYKFPAGVDGIISTFAFSLIPETRPIIEEAARALAAGGRMVLLDFQVPDRWPSWLVSLGMAAIRPFAVTDEWLERRPWEGIKSVMNQCFADVSVAEMYLGVTYLIAGTKR